MEALARAARNLGWPGDCIFHAKYGYVDARGKKAGRLHYIEPNHNGKTDFERNAVPVHYFYGNGTTSMFHRPVFERCGPFDESIGLAKVCEFRLRCCLLHGCRLHLVPRNIARYRMHESQLTRTRAGESGPKDDRIRSAILGRVPPDPRARYVEAAAPLVEKVLF